MLIFSGQGLDTHIQAISTYAFCINSRPNYEVIDTDYTSYSVVYACGVLHRFLWLLTREAVIDDSLYESMIESAKAKLPNYDFSTLAPREYQG